MLRKLTSNSLKKGLAALALMGALTLTGGCSLSVDGLGDLGDWVIDVIDDYSGGGDIIIEIDD
jgi:hypothetical protein